MKEIKYDIKIEKFKKYFNPPREFIEDEDGNLTSVIIDTLNLQALINDDVIEYLEDRGYEWEEDSDIIFKYKVFPEHITVKIELKAS